MKKRFSVEIEVRGPAGVIKYSEGAERFQFDWEFGAKTTVASVYAPTPEAWASEVPWAAARRTEVLDRVGCEVIRQKCPGCTHVVHAAGIDIIEAPQPFAYLLSRVRRTAGDIFAALRGGVRAFAFAIMAAIFGCHAQSVTSTALTCGESEASALRAAPASVRRDAAHRLSIAWAKGTRVFEDSGVVDGDMGGVRYEYCGAAHGYHLIRKADEGLFTGVLLDTATGRVLPAGHTVVFSPDASKYFAAQQPDGLDGEEWLIYARSGVQVWKGLSGIEAKSREGNWTTFIAILDQPRWTSSNELQATLRCASDTTRTTTVTLRPSAGHYAWMPNVKCAPI